MCVGIPAKVLSINKSSALVDASGARRTVSAALLDHLDPGDYVMVHAGLAIAKITDDDTDEAAAVLDALDEPQGADTL
ncbi:HypC/HybG/HupF family hydrogenase formation chaperone [Selenomonas sp.]|uniref:HypC/HybG/HupF family hydrogenase formation chaperone n=1 Tax=Selenomonas sp. TaxID=2053611 RepID=UPI002A83557A|nr:HypC/HybG/HupF family hydrogenase formation chaperone [Selenomonas sp.]MDY4417134.1 HypC/HybG/HupF family hydrogenase formation chaperone [Selenomonas sp.]